MPDDIDIEITITANVKNLDKVVTLNQELSKLQGMGIPITKAMDEMSKAGREVAGVSEEQTEAAKEFMRIKDQSIRQLEKEKSAFGDIGFQMGIYGQQVDDVSKKVGTMEELRRLELAEYPVYIRNIIEATGATGKYEQQIASFLEMSSKQTRVMGFQRKLLGSLIRSDKNVGMATIFLTQQLGGNVEAARGIVSSYRELHGAGLTLNSVQKAITSSLETATAKGLDQSTVMRYLSPVYAELMRNVNFSGREILNFKRALSISNDEATKNITKITAQRQALSELYEMQRAVRAELGATGTAMQEFSRSIFWAGLGAMFTSMSIARSLRSYEQLTRQSYTLAQAHLRIADAQKEYNETLREFGPASEEASMANRRLVESQYAYDQALSSARYSAFQFYLSLGMLVFGMFPTFMRFGEAITTLTMQFSAATTHAAGSQMLLNMQESVGVGTSSALGAAKVGLSSAIHMVAIALQNATFWQNMFIGAATMGIGIIASLGISFAATEISMKHMQDRMEDMEDELTGHSLVSDIEQGVIATTELRKVMKKAGTELPTQLSTEITTGVREPVILGRSKGNITVIINGPVVREDKDIKDIERAVKRGITKGAYSRIGRY